MPLTFTTGSVALLLKEKTYTYHIESEKLIVSRLKNIRGTTDYIRILKILYGYYVAVEIMISDYIPEEILPDINERYKSELILQDLDYFGKKPGAIPMPADLPLINSIATAFGALFVFESLTLSNSLIYDMLLNDKNLLNENNSFSFFSAYDDVTEEKWKLFISVLNKQDENEGIIKGALDNYRMFQNWIINTL